MTLVLHYQIYDEASAQNPTFPNLVMVIESACSTTLLDDVGFYNMTMACWEFSLNLKTSRATFRGSHCYVLRAHNIRIEY